MMKTFIMAAGENRRWNSFLTHIKGFPKFKTLIEINNTRIIDHIMKSVNDNNLDPLIVVSSSELEKTLNRSGYPTSLILQTPSVCHSMMKVCGPKMSTPVLFLLGDTIYDPKDLDLIINNREEGITFFGNDYEIFAVKFTTNPIPFLGQALRINNAGARGIKKNKGALHDLRYLTFYGFMPNIGFDEVSSRKIDSNFVFTEGWTTDIDHLTDLKKAMKNKELINSFK